MARSFRSGIGRLLILLIVLGLCTAGAIPALAQSPPAVKTDSADITPEKLQNSIEKIQQSKDLDEAAKNSIIAFYQEAIQDLTLAETWKNRAEEFEQNIRSADDDLARAKADLAKDATSASPLEIPLDAPLGELKRLLAEAEALLDAANQKLASAEAESSRRAIRLLEIERLLKEVRSRAANLERQEKSASEDKERGPLKAAGRIRLQAAIRAAQHEMQLYNKELAFYETTAERVPLDLDLAARDATAAKKVVKNLKGRIAEARRVEAATQVEKASAQTKQKAILANPALRKLAEKNKELAEARQRLVVELKGNAETLSKVQDILEQRGRQYKNIQEQVKSVGRTESMDLLLRVQSIGLDTHAYLQAIKQQREDARKSQKQILDLADARAKLTELENLLDATSKQDECDLLQTQKEYVDLLSKEYYQNLTTLVQLTIDEEKLVALLDDYQDFIDEHVLWSRSATPIWDVSEWKFDIALPRFLRTNYWTKPAKILAADFGAYPLPWIAALLSLIVLFYGKERAKVSVATIGQRAESSTMQNVLPTAEVLVLTVLLAVPILAFFAFIAWRIAANAGLSGPAQAFASGLWATVLVYFPIELFRQTCRTHGLAESHFGWPPTAVARLQRSLLRIILITFPLTLVVETINHLQEARWQNTLGQLCFIVAMVIVAGFMHSLLRKRGGLYREFLAQQPGGWFPRAFTIGYFFMVVVPLLLAVTAAMGYCFTASRLVSCWLQTVVFMLALIVLGAFFFRWILMVRRRLAIERSRRQREELQKIAESQPEEAASSEPAPPPVADVGLDLDTINLQARRFVYVVLGVVAAFGLWWIWDEVFPALGILNQNTLWSVDQGAGALSRAVTVADLAWALLIAGLTFVAARNIPGLIEMSVLAQLPMDKGLRYAITTVCRYLLVAIGMLWACNHLGLTWSKVQWILAAMSVGLGFGLQKIFANFVSGMVILFERPIRIGDIITIGDATGKVSKIQMRATTIIDWDKKELVVPNEEFTTGRLLNWTLTDTVNRLVIDVGVSYKSDPDQVRAILLQCAADHPKVIASPKPICIFREFGSSALMFSLRIYLASMKGRLDVIHDMHAAIHRALREAGIEIAYPQLDLHVRSGLNRSPDSGLTADEGGSLV